MDEISESLPMRAQAPTRAIIPDQPKVLVNSWEANAPAMSAIT